MHQIPAAYAGIVRGLAAHTPVCGWLSTSPVLVKAITGQDVRSNTDVYDALRHNCPTIATLLDNLNRFVS